MNNIDRTGRHHTKKTKQILSEKQKNWCKEHGNQFLTGKSQGKHTKDSLSIMSEKNSGKEPKWRGRVFQYTGCQGSFKLRSSYELAYAKWLDSQGINWKYEPKFRLSNGRTFSPDFLLENGDIIEIKGFWTEKAKQKWEIFNKDYPNINKKVLYGEDLKTLGILTKIK
jgi:predicted nuclease of restriction endonuclease-like RecB superfamily